MHLLFLGCFIEARYFYLQTPKDAKKKKKNIEKHAEISLKESLMANIMGLSFPHQGSDLLLISMHKF